MGNKSDAAIMNGIVRLQRPACFVGVAYVVYLAVSDPIYFLVIGSGGISAILFLYMRLRALIKEKH